MNHVWLPHPTNKNWQSLQGVVNGFVRMKPSPDGRYMWQFRLTVSYAESIEAAKQFVEAGAEFFDTMHRNPYSKES